MFNRKKDEATPIEGQVDLEEALIEVQQAGENGAAAAEELREAAEEAQLNAAAEELAKKLEAGGELTDEEAAKLADLPQQIPIPMMTIPLQNCQLKIVPNDEGGKNIFVGPIAVTFVLPLSEPGVQNVVRDLSGANLVVASGIPAGIELPKGVRA